LNIQSLDLTHKVLTSVDEAYWQWDLVNDKVFYSAQLAHLLGYGKESVIGSSELWEKRLDKESIQSIHAQVKQHLKEQVERIDITLPYINHRGQKLWLHALGKVVERKGERACLMFGTVRDITENHRMHRQLQSQNDWLMLSERVSHSGHWHLNIKSQELYWSPEVFRIHGLKSPSSGISITQAAEFLEPEMKAKFLSLIHEVSEHERGFSLKSRLIKSSGDKTKVEIIGQSKRDEADQIETIFGVYRDITRSEDIFEKLKLLAMVNYTIKVPIFFIDDNDNIVYQDISPNHDGASAVLFNYINFSITEYLEFKSRAKDTGQVKEKNISFDNYNNVYDLSITYEADEGIFIWIVENVTEKFRTEQQQVISNRLALLGNTFGNVSHDINNVLGVALGAIEMLELKFSKGERDIFPYIERVKNAIDKGKDVTERLLAFTRKPTINVVSFDPIQEIFDNQYLFSQLLLSTINIRFNFDSFHCLINFPQGEFINIILNLVLNAQDAIQEKGLSGQIEISANLASNSRLEVHVKDSGIGIAKENLSKVFDPFYSSKSVNKGNGIGLANVYSTMYKHNGLVQVDGNCEMGGAHFTLIFKCKKLVDKFSPEVTSGNNLRFNQTNILVLDDEVSIAEFVALFLESKGANVTVANNKKQLLDKLDSEINYDIFITDMILPDLSGKEAVQLVKEKYPNIAIYSISGYIAIEDRTWEYPVLRKPFNSKELSDFLAI